MSLIDDIAVIYFRIALWYIMSHNHIVIQLWSSKEIYLVKQKVNDGKDLKILESHNI